MTTPATQKQPSAAAARTRAWFIGTPLALQAALDAAVIVLAVATIARVAYFDMLLHMVWIVLVLEAFAFGLRVTAWRIVVATLVVMAYATQPAGEEPFAVFAVDLDLSTWPLMVIIAVVVAVMADRVTTTSRRYAARYRETQDRLLTAQEDERRRLALDLHDGVGQTITALTYTLDAVEGSLADGTASVAETAETVRLARRMALVALEETREVAIQLRPARIAETGLVAALAELASRAGAPIEVDASPELRRPGLLPLAAEVEAFRIVQEAIGNSLRYARAKRRWISVVAPSPASLSITVGDDGAGFTVTRARGRGLGLFGMQERAAAIGARLQVTARPGRGTIIRLEIPRVLVAETSHARATDFAHADIAHADVARLAREPETARSEA